MISVVLPVHNGEKYLAESVESIISQDFRDWELFLVDDGSTDSSAQIMQYYVERDFRIHMVSNYPNIGLPASLNRGFKEAKGEFLTWTSDDNRYLTEAFTEMVSFLDDNPKHMMVCANMLYMDEEGRFLSECCKYNEKGMVISNTVGACFLYRRRVLDELGGYNPSLFLVEDYEYWLRIIKEYGGIGHIDKYLYLYRHHGNSLTGTRLQEIKKRHCELIYNEFNWILSKIEDEKTIIWELYDTLQEYGSLNEADKARLESMVPELKNIAVNYSDKPVIFYGAGRVCDRALQEFPTDKITYIADASPEKYGNQKDGISIISLEELVRIQDDYQILITVGDKLMYEVMHDLMTAGIKEYCPYGLYMNTIKDKVHLG